MHGSRKCVKRLIFKTKNEERNRSSSVIKQRTREMVENIHTNHNSLRRIDKNHAGTVETVKERPAKWTKAAKDAPVQDRNTHQKDDPYVFREAEQTDKLALLETIRENRSLEDNLDLHDILPLSDTTSLNNVMNVPPNSDRDLNQEEDLIEFFVEVKNVVNGNDVIWDDIGFDKNYALQSNAANQFKEVSCRKNSTEDNSKEIEEVQSVRRSDMSDADSFIENSDDSVLDPDFYLANSRRVSENSEYTFSTSTTPQPFLMFTRSQRSTTSHARVIVPETPESSFEEMSDENNATIANQPILMSNESIKKDASILHLNETYRSSNEKTNSGTAIKIIHDVPPNYDFDDASIHILDKNVLDDVVLIDKPLKSTSTRSWDRRNCCLYCENLVTNFTRHLIRNHPEEIEVLKLTAITDPDPKEQKKRRQVITDDLRKRGNYIHNSNVVSRNEGIVIPARRKNNEELHKSPSTFVVCKNCLGTYRRSTFYRHSKKCNPETENDFQIKHTLARHALSILPAFTHVSKEFQEDILPRLRNDEISLIVKQDPLIIAYGCRLLKKKKERRSRKSICSKMRDLAHLLKIVREKHPDIAQLQDLIDPKYYENFINAVKVMSGFDEQTGHVKIISIPARIRPEILGCIEILFTNTIMDGNKSTALKDHIKNKLSEFKLLLEANWQWEISSNAEKTRKRNLMTKSQVMPLQQDIEQVIIQIHDLEEKYYKKLKKDITNVNYEQLCEVTIAHIILLDRKRSGDVAEAELQYYLNRKTDEIPPQVLETLDEKQKQAISDLDIFQIPGKRGRSVPVLLTKIMRRNIDVLIACRSTLNIPTKNKYLFARPLTEEPFDGGRCLNKIKSMCKLQKPEMLTATGLRHHIATISQVHAKTDDKYTQHLATFLGHDMNVHASNYRLPIQAIQKGLVGSRLLEIETTKNHIIDKKNESIILTEYKNNNEGSDYVENETDKKKTIKVKIKKLGFETGNDESDEQNESGISEKENNNESSDYVENEIGKKRRIDKVQKKKLGTETGNDESDEQNESDISEKKNNNENSDYTENEIGKKVTIDKIKKNKLGKLKMTIKKVQRLHSSDTESSVDMALKHKKKINRKTKKLINEESDEEIAERKQRRTKTHNKWSSAEVDAVMRHLKKYILMKKNPGKAMCEEVLRREPVLHKRKWMQINTYINNIYKKNL